MIIRNGLGLPRLAREIAVPLVVVLAYDIAVTVLYMTVGWRWLAVDELPLPLTGTAIALILTLRNNVAYGRWWEARTLWGAINNNSRSFARGVIALIDDPRLQAELVRHQIAYVLALRCHLLREPAWDALAAYLPPDAISRLRAAANVPASIHQAVARRLAALRRNQGIDTVGAASIERTLSDLANAQGGLERIKNTPMQPLLDLFPRMLSRAYCLLLPLGLVPELGWATPLGSTLIGFTFLALDGIGADLEHPFEGTIHDVPMQAITRGIEIDLLQALGESTVPPAIQPKSGVLW
ncbi:MAG: hypothetical protein JOZ42_01555 [Acetobacteraceae bacterium]|nr:hypothetical protein [Acetobacteraceae bacterium]